MRVCGATVAQVIVFFPTARAAQFHAALARASGCEAYDLHSRLSQKQRDTAAAAFGRSPTAVMFASDVIARGLDFPDVSLVVQVRLRLSACHTMLDLLLAQRTHVPA